MSLVYEVFEIASPSREWKLTSSFHRWSIAILVTLFTCYLLSEPVDCYQANVIQFVTWIKLLEVSYTPKVWCTFIHWYYLAQNFARISVVLCFGRQCCNSTERASEKNVTINQLLMEWLANSIYIPLLIVLNYCSFNNMLLGKFCTSEKSFLHSESRTQSFQKYVQSAQILLEAQGPWASKWCLHLLGGQYSTPYWPGEKQVWRTIHQWRGGGYTRHSYASYLNTPPVSVWIPFSRKWLLCSRTAPEDQLSFTTSTDTDCDNPLHLSTLVAVVGIPLYRLVIVKVFPRLKNVRMLTKMWMGLYLSLLQVILYIIVVVNHDTTYWQQHHSNETDFSPSGKCYMIRTGCDCECISHFYILQCQQYNDPVDNTYLWFVIPTAP